MRLWHIDLIPFLPNSQLKAQWRELNSIYKKQDKHILINYIYKYDKEVLYNYSMFVIGEMSKRNIKIKQWLHFNKYFQMVDTDNVYLNLRFKEHNRDYLNICFYNLMEKYLRGQKDFYYYTWNKLYKFYIEKESDFIKEDFKK